MTRTNREMVQIFLSPFYFTPTSTACFLPPELQLLSVTVMKLTLQAQSGWVHLQLEGEVAFNCALPASVRLNVILLLCPPCMPACLYTVYIIEGSVCRSGAGCSVNVLEWG